MNNPHTIPVRPESPGERIARHQMQLPLLMELERERLRHHQMNPSVVTPYHVAEREVRRTYNPGFIAHEGAPRRLIRG